MYEPGSSQRADLPLAVVVGAGGLGTAIARRLGYTHRLLFVTRTQATLDKQVALLRAEGHDVQSHPCDVSNPSDVAKLAQAVAEYGPVKTLAHVVGLSPNMADFRTIMNVNLVGPSMIADALLSHIQPGGAAVFISSLAAHLKTVPGYIPPSPEIVYPILENPQLPGFMEELEAALGTDATTTLAYGLSKGGLNRMCVRLAPSWGERGVRIVSLSPGMIATPMGALEFQHQPVKLTLLRKTPIPREATMLEIADITEFLLSDKAAFITGTDLLVDGGILAVLQNGYGRQ
jgi:NAD(P)-dependent dehydrogenase (short-subunit alcohol dehydrogenase family)